METYWKTLGGLLIAVVLGMIMGKDMSVMLSLAICVPMLSLCMVACDEDEVKEMDTPCGQGLHQAPQYRQGKGIGA